ncbi:MAG: CvpA family protein, partial [Bacteroidetes bacterium]
MCFTRTAWPLQGLSTSTARNSHQGILFVFRSSFIIKLGNMNWVDVVLILVVLLAIWGGWQRGFILGTLDLVNWLGSILLGITFYSYTASFLKMLFPSLGVWLLPVAFFITIILARILIGLVTSRIAWFTGPAINESAINKFLGMIPGFITGVIYATIVAALLLALPLWDDVT